jgi:hypothetical protein
MNRRNALKSFLALPATATLTRAEIIPVDKEAYARGSPEWQDFSELLPRLDLDDRSSWSGPIEKNPLEHLERALRRKIT